MRRVASHPLTAAPSSSLASSMIPRTRQAKSSTRAERGGESGGSRPVGPRLERRLPIRPAASGRFHAERLFRPDSVAVIGAKTELGGTVMQNMLAAGFRGAVLPVVERAGAVNGVLAYPDVAALPCATDAATDESACRRPGQGS